MISALRSSKKGAGKWPSAAQHPANISCPNQPHVISVTTLRDGSFPYA
jgi:hypothetical protein